jgi:hypothetical protein
MAMTSGQCLGIETKQTHDRQYNQYDVRTMEAMMFEFEKTKQTCDIAGFRPVDVSRNIEQDNQCADLD